MPLRSPLGVFSAEARSLRRSPTTCAVVRPASEPRQRRLVSWHSFLLARLASVPSAADHYPLQKARECNARLAPSVSSGNRLLPCLCASVALSCHKSWPQGSTPENIPP